MFGPSRRELSRQLERERMRNQQRETELVNQIIFLTRPERPWTIPAHEAIPDATEDEPVYASAIDYLPGELDDLAARLRDG